MSFYVAVPNVHPIVYHLVDTVPVSTDRHRNWRGYVFEQTPEFIVHSKMHGSHDKAKPYVVRGVATGGRLLVQTIAESVTEYDKIDTWHEIDGEYTVEGYRFKRYALKPMLTLIKLGVTAAKTRARAEKKAAKQGERDEKCGTCPCCFGDYVVTTAHLARYRHVTTKMVHHGYERPGDGYIHGDCHGVGFEPFEISCEGTKSWLNQLRGILNYRREALRQLDLCDEIIVEYKVRRGWGGKVQLERKTIKRSEDAHGFKTAVENKRFELERDIEKITRDIGEYEKRIAEWKPQPWPRVQKGK